MACQGSNQRVSGIQAYGTDAASEGLGLSNFVIIPKCSHRDSLMTREDGLQV